MQLRYERIGHANLAAKSIPKSLHQFLLPEHFEC